MNDNLLIQILQLIFQAGTFILLAAVVLGWLG